MRAGLKSCKLLWDDECPPRSTLKEWARKVAEQGHTNPPGWPRTLQVLQNAALVQYFLAMRQAGGPMDREIRCKNRLGAEGFVLPEIKDSRVRDFKRRQGWT